MSQQGMKQLVADGARFAAMRKACLSGTREGVGCALAVLLTLETDPARPISINVLLPLIQQHLCFDLAMSCARATGDEGKITSIQSAIETFRSFITEQSAAFAAALLKGMN